MIQILRWLLNLVRFILFSFLILIRPVFVMIFGVASGFCLFGFLFCALFQRDQQTVLWALLGAGIVFTMLLWLYDVVLLFFAPNDFILISGH
jgi:hypothetical protein